MPINTFAIAFGRLLSLAVLNFSFCICCYFLIPSLDSFGHIMPKSLRFSLLLFIDRACRWWSVSGMRRVKDEFLLSGLGMELADCRSSIATRWR